MKRSFWILGLGALLIAIVASLGGAVRPLLFTALLTNQQWPRFVFGASGQADWLNIPAIYAVLILEIFEALASIAQGTALTYLAANMGRSWRTKLTRATLHSMAGEDNAELGRYIALSKTYVEVVETFHRHYLIPTVAASAQLAFSIAFASTMGTAVAMLLLFEVGCITGMTIIYARIHVILAKKRMDADELVLRNSGLNPRKGVAIWFGGTGSLWFRMRIREIKTLANARIRLGVGEVAYLNLITFAIGLFIVGGYFVIVDWQHRAMDNFLAFLLYCGLMTGPVIRVSSFIPECREYLQAKRNLEEAIASCPQPEYRLQSTEQLSFSANDNRANRNRKIDIRAGDRIALIGPSGSGKTTTIEALLGAKGGILGNPSIATHASSSVRLALPHAGVRYSTETPVFEAGTVQNNCQISLAECEQIASAFGLFSGQDKVALRLFFKRTISASGEPLSLGERQRVQLLRTLGARPQVLILDEALSGVEEGLERDIVSRLISDRSISTLVYIGHRKSIQRLFENKYSFEEPE
jgi:ABC-type bacteriocin/lantibiotic exporter with double-glycine peptidase domain